MIMQFKDYEATKAYTGGTPLPAGAYKCTIIGAKVEEYGGSQCIKVGFDISEGEHKGRFQAQFDSSKQNSDDAKWPVSGTYSLWVPLDDGSDKDEWTKRKFKTFTTALEDSNSGYHFDWDEKKFKGKKIGFTIVPTFYQSKDGSREGVSPSVYDVVSIPDIDKKKYRKLPGLFVPSKLKSAYAEYQKKQVDGSSDQDSYTTQFNVPEGEDEDVPFL